MNTFQLGIVNPDGSVTPKRLLFRGIKAETITLPAAPKFNGKSKLYVLDAKGEPLFCGEVEIQEFYR